MIQIILEITMEKLDGEKDCLYLPGSFMKLRKMERRECGMITSENVLQLTFIIHSEYENKTQTSYRYRKYTVSSMITSKLLLETTKLLTLKCPVTVSQSVRTMAVSNFKKTLKTPFVGAFQMISDPIG